MTFWRRKFSYKEISCGHVSICLEIAAKPTDLLLQRFSYKVCEGCSFFDNLCDTKNGLPTLRNGLFSEPKSWVSSFWNHLLCHLLFCQAEFPSQLYFHLRETLPAPHGQYNCVPENSFSSLVELLLKYTFQIHSTHCPKSHFMCQGASFKK